MTAIVGPNGSGKSNVAEAFRWVLGEQSLKSLRGKRGEDLIFSGPEAGGRLNRACVQIIFDNSDRRFDIDFDEVTITREVFKDGSNEYSINGSNVRLRDVLELLGQVALGSAGHHIISQGEADRVLSSGPVERRGMIEEALGLRVFQWKLEESEKKLAKTEENKKQVESLRREIAPHLKFLKKQVEKLEKAAEFRRELKTLYHSYFKRESLYLEFEQKKINTAEAELKNSISILDDKIKISAESLSVDQDQLAKEQELILAERKLREARDEKNELVRKLGRVDGLLEIREARIANFGQGEEVTVVALGRVENLAGEIRKLIGEAEGEGEIRLVRNLLQKIKERLASFFAVYERPSVPESYHQELIETKKEKAELEERLAELNQIEKTAASLVDNCRLAIKQMELTTRGAEKELFVLKGERNEKRSELDRLLSRKQIWERDQADFKRELEEALVLVDREILFYEQQNISLEEILDEGRPAQEDRRRQIEKLKIRLEDMGVEQGDVLEEYKEVTERDNFLAGELIDLEKTAESLKEVMVDLRLRIDRDFKEGVTKINVAFQEFFARMFGGGTAKLELIAPVVRKSREEKLLLDDESVAQAMDEDKNLGKEGIEIAVSLPRKKIKGLAMLSGGERALTSIALLFAMSRVNPPPFLILDETDAALDEANSRKYGEMIESLAKYSQLIVITHNRETMSRAGVLYGVTMGADGVSRLLSIKFDEATAYAK